MKKTLLLTCLLLPLLSTAQLQSVFKHKIDSIYAKHKDAVGIMVHVESPKQQISWSYATGVSDIKTEVVLKHEQPVLIASNTKPYVAAAVLRLVEAGKITLNQPIKKVLSKQTNQMFEKASYDFDKITVKHLLSHTSGIQDYVNDAYFELVNQKPKYNWTKEEQIKRSLQMGEPQKVGGEV